MRKNADAAWGIVLDKQHKLQPVWFFVDFGLNLILI